VADHGAAGSALGYLYQTDWALLELLRRAHDRPDQALTLELFDDVAWDAAGLPQELLQLKHHISATGDLTDYGVDIWRTLRVWLDSPMARDQQGPLLTLVTTAVASPGSAASLLKNDPTRNPVNALGILNAAARDSANASTATARQLWLSQDQAVRLRLVERIYILDSAMHIEDLDEAVARELRWAIPIDHQDVFLGLVWRWWRAVAIDLLLSRRGPVDAIEARRTINRFRDSFSSESLPTLIELADVDEQAVADVHENYTFVHQLRLVGVSERNLRRAIVDYYRAVNQSAKWLSESLIGFHELQRFEDNLRDEWGRAFDNMLEDIPGDSTEEAKQELGRALFRRLSDSNAVTVRSRYSDPFYSRGTRHLLADSTQIGWHPEFEARLRELLLHGDSELDDTHAS
jgi:hypothetical protein